MTTQRARPLLIALLAVLAVGIAAATLNSAVAVEGDVGLDAGSGSGQGPGGESDDRGSGSPFSVGIAGEGGAEPVIPVPCYPILNDPRFLLAAGAVALAAGYLLYRWKGPLVPVGVAAGIAPPLLIVHTIFTACRAADSTRISLPMGGEGNSSPAFSIGTGGSGGGSAAGGMPAPSIALIGVLGLVLVGAVVLLFVSTDDQVVEAGGGAEEEEEPAPTAAIGRAAGRAADRIENDADPDNEVFRAWHEMTTYLDVADPETSSPGEFAEAAVEAGMEPDDVARLTRLFEEVRYGGADATGEREARAVEALRRIESEYAGDT